MRYHVPVGEGPHLIVGLGNPGPSYAHHRHNIGFMAVEAWLARTGAAQGFREKFCGRMAQVTQGRARCVVLEPLTFMNRSGASVREAAAFFNVPPPGIVVVHDELDFVFGRVAIKEGGGHGGHNGLRDIMAVLGEGSFTRIRVGIGRPPHGDVTNWVLSGFDDGERAALPDVLTTVGDAIDAIVTHGTKAAMNSFNRAPVVS